MTEAELIKKARRGDERAFEELIKPRMSAVYNLALRMMRNEADARDAAQNAIIKIFTNLGSYRGDSSFSTWVFSVTRNACLDELRRVKRFSTEPIPDDASAGEMYDPVAAADAAEDRREVADLVSGLPENMRAPIVLKYIDGYSVDEIAEIMGITEATVKTRLFRGRQKLRELLDGKK